MMFQGLDFCGALICFRDIGFARAQGGLILVDQFPINWATRAENEKTRERKKVEEFQRRAIIDCDTKFTNPEIITDSGQLVEFMRGRWGCVSVRLFFMMMVEVIEGLNFRGRSGVKVDSVFIDSGELL